MPPEKRQIEKELNRLNPQQAILQETERIVDRLDEANEKLDKEIVFPEVQKVEVINPQEKQQVEVLFPDVQKVEVINQQKFPEQKAPIVNVEAPIINLPPPVVNIPKTEFPTEMKVEVTNFPEIQKVDIQKVELVDKNGKPVNMQPIVNVSQPSYPTPFQYGGRIPDSIKVTNNVSVTDSNQANAQGSTTSGQVGPLMQGATTTSAPTYVAGTTNPLSLTVGGSLRTQVTAITGGTGATSLGKGEDNAHASGDTGVFMLGVRNDNSAVFSDTDGDYTPIATTASGNLKIVGSIVHDTADNGAPVKIGAKATDYAPDTAGEQGQTAVTAADRVDIAANLRGEIIEGVKAEYTTLTNVSTTYNNTTTTATSGAVTCWQYRYATLSYELDKANTPTDIVIRVQMSLDGTNYADFQNDFFGDLRYDDTAVGSGGFEHAINFPIACQAIKVKVTATGTDATNTFTMANAVLYLRN